MNKIFESFCSAILAILVICATMLCIVMAVVALIGALIYMAIDYFYPNLTERMNQRMEKHRVK